MPKIKFNLAEYAYLDSAQDYRRQSAVELFNAAWAYHCPNLPLRKEYLFAYPRKFKADYVHFKSKVLIDIQGAIHTRGGHSTGTGIIRDCEKLMTANLLGYQMFYLTKELLTSNKICLIRQHIEDLLALNKT
jgi:hypothetical protein